MTETKFAMVSEWMPSGNITEFVTVRQDANRFELVSPPFTPQKPLHIVDDCVVSAVRRRCKGLDLYARSGYGPWGPQRGTSLKSRSNVFSLNGIQLLAQYPCQSKRSCPPRRFWTCDNHLRLNNPELIQTRGYYTLDGSRALRPENQRPPSDEIFGLLRSRNGDIRSSWPSRAVLRRLELYSCREGG